MRSKALRHHTTQRVHRLSGMSGPGPLGRWMDEALAYLAPCPFRAHAGLLVAAPDVSAPRPLYTPEERRRRDQTPWTMVQGVLAPFQFLVFLVSTALVVRYLITGEGLALAMWSVVAKTMVLYAIMITGSVWEKVVFDRWLFAPSFYWEDVVSMLVLALHTAYLGAIFLGIGTVQEQMVLALAAYAVYVINAMQFLLKLRAARLEAQPVQAGA